MIDRREHHDHGDGHDRAPVGGVLLEEGLQAERQGEDVAGPEEHEGDQVVVPGHQEREDRGGEDAGQGVAEHDLGERPEHRAAVDPGRFLQGVWGWSRSRPPSSRSPPTWWSRRRRWSGRAGCRPARAWRTG